MESNMVNSNSLGSEGNGNAEVNCVQSNSSHVKTQSSSPITASSATHSKIDFLRTADSSQIFEAQAVEPTPSKTDTDLSFNSLTLSDLSRNTGIGDGRKRFLCSVPLEKVQTVVAEYTLSLKGDKNKVKIPRKVLCLYCDRTFVNANLRCKHVERCHSSKHLRRVSLRKNQNLLTSTPCIYCDKFTSTEHTLKELFEHLIHSHSKKYFGCLSCEERYLNTSYLADHNVVCHNSPTASQEISSSVRNDIALQKTEKSENKNIQEEIPLKVRRKKQKTRNDKQFLVTGKKRLEKLEHPLDSKKSSCMRNLRNKKLSVKTSRMILKRSKRLQAKLIESHKKKRTQDPDKTNKHFKPEQTFSTKLNEKSTKPSSFVNPYPEFDNFFQVKKITDHSIDNLKISSLTFDDVFDKAFFNRIKSNIQENLLHHIDGKLFKNEESENRISNFEKVSNVSQEVQNQNSENYGCELSLNAITPTTLLLSSQFGEDPESQIEYGSKPSKKKTQTKKDEIHYKYFTRRKYQASILEHKENRDLSKLDMWTQYVIRNRQQKVLDDKKTSKEILDYFSGEEYKNIKRREELNRILDRRGPFEDLREEVSKKAALDKLNGEDNCVSDDSLSEVGELLNDILNKVFELARETCPQVSNFVSNTCHYSENCSSGIPSYLNLRPNTGLNSDNEIDKSDRIALICSSQETENFELPSNTVRGKNEKVELTGEWARSRIYVCAACGLKLQNIKQFLEHKSASHQYIWVQHYEFVGNQSELYRHLSIPVLGKVGVLENLVQCKMWKRSDARLCTKCGKQCNSLGELHRHVLECGGDWTWMLARKKCKYRPFGAKSRRKRRGLVKRIYNQKTEPSEKKIYKKQFDMPRQKASDADTIKRMLANLPAKRVTRKIISLKDGFNTSRTKQVKSKTQIKFKCGKLIRGKTREQSKISKLEFEKVNKKQQPKYRRSLRCLNKVLTSRILDTNSTLIVRRKCKRKITNQTKKYNRTVKEQSKVTQTTPAKVLPKRNAKASNTPVSSSTEKQVKEDPKPKRCSSRLEKHVNCRTTGRTTGMDKINIKRFFPVKKKKNFAHIDSVKSSLDKKINAKSKSGIRNVDLKEKNESVDHNHDPTIDHCSDVTSHLETRKRKFDDKVEDVEVTEKETENKKELSIDKNVILNKKRKLRDSVRNAVNKLKTMKKTNSIEHAKINDVTKTEPEHFFEVTSTKTEKLTESEAIAKPTKLEKDESPVSVFDTGKQIAGNTTLQTDKLETDKNVTINTGNDVVNAIQNSTAEKIKKKIRRPARGLNDCIAMLTSKLGQCLDSSTSSSINEICSQPHTDNVENTNPMKTDYILKIPLFNEHFQLQGSKNQDSTPLVKSNGQVMETIITAIAEINHSANENTKANRVLLATDHAARKGTEQCPASQIEDIVKYRKTTESVLIAHKAGEFENKSDNTSVITHMPIHCVNGHVEDTSTIGVDVNILSCNEITLKNVPDISTPVEIKVACEHNLVLPAASVDGKLCNEEWENNVLFISPETAAPTKTFNKLHEDTDSEDDIPLSALWKDEMSNRNDLHKYNENSRENNYKNPEGVNISVDESTVQSNTTIDEIDNKKRHSRYQEKYSFHEEIKGDLIECNTQFINLLGDETILQKNTSSNYENLILNEEKRKFRSTDKLTTDFALKKIERLKEKESTVLMEINENLPESRENMNTADLDVTKTYVKNKNIATNKDLNAKIVAEAKNFDNEVIQTCEFSKDMATLDNLFLQNLQFQKECDIDSSMNTVIHCDDETMSKTELSVDSYTQDYQQENVTSVSINSIKDAVIAEIEDLIEQDITKTTNVLVEAVSNNEYTEDNDITAVKTKNVLDSSDVASSVPSKRIINGLHNVGLEYNTMWSDVPDRNKKISTVSSGTFEALDERVDTIKSTEDNLLESFELDDARNSFSQLPNAESNVESEFDHNGTLRRSRRNSKRITSYNELDVIDPVFDDLDTNKSVTKIIKETTKQLFRVKRKKSKHCSHKKASKGDHKDKKVNGDELFDLLKSTPSEDIVLPKPTNSFFSNFDAISDDFNDDNFDDLEDILEKSMAVIEENLAEKTIPVQIAEETIRIQMVDLSQDHSETQEPSAEKNTVSSRGKEEMSEKSESSTNDVDNKKKSKHCKNKRRRNLVNVASNKTSTLENEQRNSISSSDIETVLNLESFDANDIENSNTQTNEETKMKVNENEKNKVKYCDICNKSFSRAESLTKHKRTLTHISKLSELEAQEAALKLKDDQAKEDITEILESSSDSRKGLNLIDILESMETRECKQFSSSFVVHENNSSLKLADIINDVLNKPILRKVEDTRVSEMQPEMRRYKNLAERKSFESENCLVSLKNNSHIKSIHYFEPEITNAAAGTILEKQITLLENIIENRSSLNYIDELSMTSDRSINETSNENRLSGSSSKQCDSVHTYSNQCEIENNYMKANLDKSFLKPSHYEEISEDSNLRNYDEQKSRKALNRDEELFLECCSLLKSGSEISNYSKKSHNICKELNHMNMKPCDEDEWLEDNCLPPNESREFVECYSDNSRIRTPLGDSFSQEDSNSATISSQWNMNGYNTSVKNEWKRKLNNKNFTFEEAFNSNKNEEHIFCSTNDEDVNAEISTFDRVMSEVFTTKMRTSNEDEKESTIFEEGAKISFEDKKGEKSSCTSTVDNKKMLTKGAMKVFEGLKVSIPTEELNIANILTHSPSVKPPAVNNTDFANVKAHKGRTDRNSKPIKSISKVENKKKKTMKPLKTKKQHNVHSACKVHDVYDFEETQDNSDVFVRPDFRSFRIEKNKKTEKQVISDSESQDCVDANSFDAFSSSNSSVSELTTKSRNPQNITKKKCMIMGRIFRNAVKSRIIDEDIRNIPVIDNTKLVEEFVLSCTEPKHVVEKKTNLTQEELNLAFDKLVNSSYVEAKQMPPPVCSLLNEKIDCKNIANKKKSKTKNKKRGHYSSDSSDDEFKLQQCSKKRSSKKNNKNEDNCINLEQELKECIGVASRKSQRKCTSGKQNILMEYWSSDESSFETLLETKSMELIENNLNSKELRNHLSQNAEFVEIKTNSSNVVCDVTQDENKKTIVQPEKKGKLPSIYGLNRRKRTAVNPLYHWSSSSEDETRDLIEVKPLRDEIEDDEDRPVQHGWIVGDSPKKLVTMLAQAKGKKCETDSVKEHGKKRTSPFS